MKSKNYLKSFESFIDKSINIIIDNPQYSRCVIKYTHSKKYAILKVTDDKNWALYKLTKEDQQQEIEKFVKIVTQLLSNIQFQTGEIEEELQINSQNNLKKNKNKKKRV